MLWLPNTNITQVGSEPHPDTPLQALKVEPAAGVATSVSTVGLGMKLPVGEGNGAEQMSPQLIPAGSLTTVPFPLPVFVISIKL
jgi:hypothetical protein